MSRPPKDPVLKQIYIKTGVVKRVTKEKAMYEKEVEKEEEKLQKKQSDGSDEHDVNKQREIMEESKMMIPECKKRMVNAIADLKALVEKDSDMSDEQKEDEVWKEAKKVLEEAEKATES